MRVGELTMHDDDWEVTRPASLQPERAEKNCWQWVCRITLLGELYHWALRNRPWGDSDARRVTSSGGCAWGKPPEVRGQIREAVCGKKATDICSSRIFLVTFHPKKSGKNMPIIEIKHLYKTYAGNDRPAVADLCLSVAEGEILACWVPTALARPPR